MKLPGVVWSALLVALPLLAVWLGDSFPAAVWAAPVAGLLLIAAKVVAVLREETPQPPPGVAASDSPVGPSRASRMLWG